MRKTLVFLAVAALAGAAHAQQPAPKVLKMQSSWPAGIAAQDHFRIFADRLDKISGGNVKGAEAIGTAIAQRSIEKGIKRVVFDRSGFLYHGRIRAVADAARKAGLEF